MIALVVAVALIGASMYALTIDRSVSQNLQRASGSMPEETPRVHGQKPRPRKIPKAKNALNFVLLGSDSRAAEDAGDGRSDTLMLLHLTKDRKNAYLISFPRDLYVPIPGHGKNKINAAFALGGPALTVETLENLLDTRMDHVALIDFDGFIRLTEDLGGVTVYNEHASVSNNIRFPKGYITLSGEQALTYVRQRHGLPQGDLDRAERQRLVLQAIFAKCVSEGTFTHPRRFTRFAAGVAKHVVVDDKLTDSELRKTALSLRLTANSLHLMQTPVAGLGMTPDKQSIVLVNHHRLAKLAEALQHDDVDRYLSRYPRG